MQSWLPVPRDSDFTVHNLPFGIFSVDGGTPRAGVAIGDQIIDLTDVHEAGLFEGLSIDADALRYASLNAFISHGKTVTSQVRERLQAALCNPESLLKEYPRCLIPMHLTQMHLPIEIGDYTDFYSSLEHATNVGTLFRDPENALLPNWRHLPVGYHGRSSSIGISGAPICRPAGQVLQPGSHVPTFQPTDQLDFELELAFVVGKASGQGQAISIDTTNEYLFGLVLFNDWSARDIQRWEYVPLGPFLGKNFASSISPWIVPIEAFAPYTVAGPAQNPAVLPYLQSKKGGHLDIQLEVSVQPFEGLPEVICHTNARHLYWSMAQQLAHHTVNGCNVNVGDLMASGTISGSEPGSYGSLLEMTRGGQKPITLSDGTQRSFLMDHDTIIMRGHAGSGSHRVGFGHLENMIVPCPYPG